MVLEGGKQVEVAALKEIGEEGEEEGLPEAGVLEEMVALVTTLPGRGSGWEVIPGAVGGEFLEDELEDEAVIQGGTAAGSGGEEGLEETPLVVGEERGRRSS
jgi:hypothetical protein